MKILCFFLSYSFIICTRSVAQDGLEGTWQGKFDSDYMTSEVSWNFSDQTYELDLENDGSIEVSGRWETKENHLYLWDTGGPMGCPEAQRGEYTFEINENTLRITLVDDICPGRKMMGPGIKWIRKE